VSDVFDIISHITDIETIAIVDAAGHSWYA
jgi:hypothetical protein